MSVSDIRVLLLVLLSVLSVGFMAWLWTSASMINSAFQHDLEECYGMCCT